MPIDLSWIFAQDLRSQKIDMPETTNRNPNLALKITAVEVIFMFEDHGVLSKEEAYDEIRKKWMVYQNEHIPQIFYVKI